VTARFSPPTRAGAPRDAGRDATREGRALEPVPHRIASLTRRDLGNPAAGGSEQLGHQVTLVCGGPAARRDYRVVSAGGDIGHFFLAPRALPVKSGQSTCWSRCVQRLAVSDAAVALRTDAAPCEPRAHRCVAVAFSLIRLPHAVGDWNGGRWPATAATDSPSPSRQRPLPPWKKSVWQPTASASFTTGSRSLVSYCPRRRNRCSWP
jgi:hypothetical protein